MFNIGAKSLADQPIVNLDNLDLIPSMLQKAGAWLEHAGRKSMIVEIPHQ
jgi:hypothetical protein